MSDTETIESQDTDIAVDDVQEADEVIRIDSIDESDIAGLSDDDLMKLQDAQLDEGSDAEEVASDVDEPEDVQGSKDKTPKDERTLEQKVQDLQKQIEGLEKVKNDRGDFIEKQNSIISSLQNKLDGLSKHKEDLDKKTSNEGFWENPKEALKAETEKAKVEQQIEAANKELQYRQNKSAIEQVVPDYEAVVDDIIDYLKEVDPPREVELNGELVQVGTTDDVVAQFKKDPFVLNAQKAIDFVNNARLFKKSQLYKQKAEVLEGKPRQILDKVNKAAQYRTATSRSSGTSESSVSEVSDSEIASMSDTELQNFIKNAERNVER